MIGVYVAASSRELSRAESVHQALREIPGVVPVSGWMNLIRSHLGTADADLPADMRKRERDACIDELSSAHVLLYLAPPPETPSRMGWFELGYAAALHDGAYYPKRILVSGPHARDSICTEGYEIHDTDADAIEAIRKMAERGRVNALGGALR